jgi:hypothetical protein
VASPTDASADARALADADTGSDVASDVPDGGSCPTPLDVWNWTPPAYKHAIVQHGACTAQQIDDFFQACLSFNATQAMCNAFTNANQVCAHCIITPSIAPSYGPLIQFNQFNGFVSVNVAGCVEIVDTQNGATCAAAMQAFDACGHAACDSVCPVTNDPSFQLWEQCVQTADAVGCKSYFTAATCANAEAADGGAAAGCFIGSSFEDLYKSVAPFFCE